MSALKFLNIYTFWGVIDVDFNKREIKGNAYVNTSAARELNVNRMRIFLYGMELD